MPSVTIELDPAKYSALSAIAREQGLAGPEQILLNHPIRAYARIPCTTSP